MSSIPYDQAAKVLRSVGCDTNDHPPKDYPYGHGEWWRTALGSSFFLAVNNPTGEVDEFVLRRLLADIARTMPIRH